MGIVSTYKYHGDEIDEIIAHSDANILHDEIQDKDSIHDEIIRIISTRSKQQLLDTFNHFNDIHGTSISRVCTHNNLPHKLRSSRNLESLVKS